MPSDRMHGLDFTIHEDTDMSHTTGTQAPADGSGALAQGTTAHDALAPRPDRRAFLESVTLGAAALAASMAAAPMASAMAESAPARRPGFTGPWSDAWLDGIKGTHKQFFDGVTINDGFAMVFATGFLNLNKEAYGLGDHDLTAVVGLRHLAMLMALSDAMWVKYGIGKAFSINDPTTKAVAARNPFLHKEAMPLPGSDIPTLVGRGVIFTVCNVALTVLSGKLAGGAGVSADDAKKEWTANLVPGMTIVPVGVLAVNRAQEKGCTYCYGG
jgi:intracellular sulfur oxidation DsrE/DsrF family protein